MDGDAAPRPAPARSIDTDATCSGMRCGPRATDPAGSAGGCGGVPEVARRRSVRHRAADACRGPGTATVEPSSAAGSSSLRSPPSDAALHEVRKCVEASSVRVRGDRAGGWEGRGGNGGDDWRRCRTCSVVTTTRSSPRVGSSTQSGMSNEPEVAFAAGEIAGSFAADAREFRRAWPAPWNDAQLTSAWIDSAMTTIFMTGVTTSVRTDASTLEMSASARARGWPDRRGSGRDTQTGEPRGLESPARARRHHP